MPASAAAGPAAEGEEKVAEAGGGELLYCGTTRFDIMGRKVKGVMRHSRGNLVSPTRLRPLMGVDIRFVASGCAACHCVALGADGRCFTWGRNEKGQLGHGDTLLRNLPTVVSELSKYNIITASVGRNHTVIVTDDGKSFAFGDNKHGQLGTGSLRKGTEVLPAPCLVTEATNAVCGADFTVWLSSVEGCSILTAGLPQYGQLGHGSDNEYNTKVSSVKLSYDPQPRPRAIATLSGKAVVKVACGTNHTVAVDSSGFVYTWGFGGYGRLGHNEQKDEWQPCLVEIFQKNNILGPNDIISAGSASSACTAGGRGQLYMWGKLKNSGDEWMYPKPVTDLSGWNIRCMACGSMHHIVGADDSCISWSHSEYGELGYGLTQNKEQDTNTSQQHATHETAEETPEQVTKKATPTANSRSNKRKTTVDHPKSEDGKDESGEVPKEAEGCHGPSTRSGRGSSAKTATPEPMPSGRGRGRGRPKKGTESESPVTAPLKVGSSGRGGKRGRPRK